jgi:hypothetical protein
MITKDAKHNRENIIRQHQAHFGEWGLYNVSKDYHRIILLFDARPSSRATTIHFPQEDINSLYIKEGLYNHPISYFFKKNKHFHSDLEEKIIIESYKKH